VRTVAYLRVSSKAQSWEMQRDAIKREAEERGHMIASWYTEKVSGKSLRRPELDALRADARDGKLGRIYLFRLDRLTRSGVADTFHVVNELRNHGVAIVTVSEHLTIKPAGGTTPDVTSDVLLFAFALAAQIERTAINERIAAARTRVEAEGGTWGRPRRVQGAPLVTMRAMKQDGKTVRQIAAAMGVPRSTVARALSRKVARGETRPTSRAEPATRGAAQ
jgi:DNA invertase Pin-like site-specific DNA recombinase